VAAVNRRLLEFEGEIHDLRAQGDEGLAKSLAKINGPDTNTMIAEQTGRLLKAGDTLTDRQLANLMTLLSLSRLASDAEWKAIERHLKERQPRRQALEDIFWAHINSKEFCFRQ
jgi:hypothetical protein